MKKIPFLIITCQIICTFSYSQSLYLGFGGGYSSINPYSIQQFTYENDNLEFPCSFVELNRQNTDKGFGFSSSIKYKFKKVPINIICYFNYFWLNGTTNNIEATVPPHYSIGQMTGDLETRYNLYTINFGFQWELIQSSITPYLSASSAFTRLNNITSNIEASDDTSEDIKYKVKAENGISIGGGFTFDFFRSIETNIEILYTFNNLFSKEKNEESLNSLNLKIIFYMKLLDFNNKNT